VQDVFVAALTGLRTFRGSSSLRSWLLGIARHKVEDYYRRRLREPGALPEDGEGDEPSSGDMPVDEVFDRERAEARTHDVLRQLPESYSLALLWRYWENRSVRERAGATGKTEKAIERLLARARERFRSLWSQRHG
jgi:RNA polymerase sigma-70 factor (ECF subfamily)